MIKISSVHLFFALPSLLGLRLTHADVPNDYVKGLLRELIYMKVPRDLDVDESMQSICISHCMGLCSRVAAGMRR